MVDERFWRGRRVWIIGASSGIGRSLVDVLGPLGAELCLSARQTERLTAVDAEAASAGWDVRTVPLDVSEGHDAIAAAAHDAEQAMGAVDVLIYAAGAWTPASAAGLDAPAIRHQTDVNYLGLVSATAAVLPGMLQRREGVIAGLASASSYAPLPRAEGYGASKAAMVYFLQSLRIDLHRTGVKVSTAVPGFVDTPLTAQNDFSMPFMIRPDQAARTIVRGLERGRAEIAFPRRLTVPLKLTGSLPRAVKEWVVRATLKRK